MVKAAKQADGTSGGRKAPRDFEALRNHVAASQTSLPKRLAQAAHYALAHPDEIALGTAASLADAAAVQPSTLVRLARHLGYDGFTDFQTVFRDRLKDRASSYEERLQSIEKSITGDSYEGALLNGFLSSARQSIDSLSEAINPADFARCISVLAEAETIYIVAKRRAYPLAVLMSYTFGKLGIRTVTVDSANGIDQEIVQMATPKDAAIACSFAPYAPATVEQALALTRGGVPLVAITDTALSPLASCTKHWLEVSEHDFAGFRSLSASMALTMALPVAVAERRRLRG
ncbi:MAG: MurR/RpiR family transcriptional regulator [Hoeflea sp.]|uniref:MurR/RpiR family transcriptional regulator n=1 Tax=Hoeflea sp. TaxID=1940281 RepID=UPI001D2412FB|nr:MurR/RpiR family transcriptional regulator [Hoeflea sp.]MBU4528070.1 MurR/RpiR family transcriptional regulator [Alphaproteobacteria bacterium]MBU4543667.1 MurR/RpiR family transcriptional regulator [Alphaproteobacteria bacterium]MBU4548533.1 MurR/RpiR family transcriptional regulator [Alphaproteobacteria bacterium]MBV1725700.1 MurR/RpiR family transcriptional regulator [Hoeflea sp.]MBV1762056.1 MurR/RpiR family transcriptional regulator [Hoeflea sp.]